eukprot:TRINITY_DN24154_c0_g1_i1.p1 TRINITY_DN24154_c0_g1~~TRINITY_DN24154_c0_g1_i1.p1  ORF type:complete len:330 (-),score=115.04 TRINITY_DN24154_c0_g1_i1:122-1111(-)
MAVKEVADDKKAKKKKVVEAAAANDEATKKGKKRKAENQEIEAAEETKKPKKKGKGNKAGGENRSDLSDRNGGVSEEVRRNAQREIQQLVVKLRAEGKSQYEIDAAKRDLKASFGNLQQPESKRSQKKEAWLEKVKSTEGQEERKERATKEHELVVIPVFWRGRHDKLDVVKAAEDIKAVVAQQGVDCWVDSRRHYKPGQKFAHWEHRGVMLRVEIGPEDLEAGVCRVCKAHTPGDYKSVEKKRIKLPPAGNRSLLLALKEWGLSQIEIDRREGDSADEEEAEESSKAVASGAKVRSKTAEVEEGDDDIQGNWAPKQKPVAGKKKKGKF